MGVHGLWRLIEPSGKPVPVESLENKVLAVDVSIWLHQAIKGFQDAKGAPAVNAHLLGIFHRVCKLLYFKIKPVFVFDGGVPQLKKETIAKRNKLKHKNISEADKIQKQLLETLIKHSAVNKVLGEKAKTAINSVSPTKSGKTTETDKLFKLPEPQLDSTNTSSDEEDQESEESSSGSPTKHWNLHNIDTKSDHFKSLPADVRHEILTDLKETRKQSSWGRLHELPTQSDDFSGFQMKRLLKRQEVQQALEVAEKEMGGHSLSLGELEEILKDQGVISKNTMGSRIASDENTRYLYIRDVKQALEKARQLEEKKLSAITEETEMENETIAEASSSKADLELQEDIQKAIALSLQDQPSSSGYVQKKKLADMSFLENFGDVDSESEDSDNFEDVPPKKNTKLTSAQNYMMEYSGLNPNEIARIIASNEKKKPQKRKLQNIDERNENSTANTVDTKLQDNSEMRISNNIPMSSENKESPELEEPELKKAKINEETNEDSITPNTEQLKDRLEFMSNSGDSDEDLEEAEDKLPENKETKVEEVKTDGKKIPEDEQSDKLEVISGTGDSDEDFKEVEDILPENEEAKVEEVKTDEPLDKLEVISGSGDSDEDFEEVEDILPEKSEVKEEKVLEIKIEADNIEEDDLFADVFTPATEIENKIENKEEIIEESKKEDKVHEEEIVIKNVEEKVTSEIANLPQDVVVPKIDPKPPLTEEELKKMRNDLNREELELRNEQGLRERLGTNITDQMYKEAQDLLELFGLPYVVAPMEAEAQCAYLESVSLTDGTITDDSDIWLFGGKTTYKNFFNQSKHVLEYRAEDIKHHFKLTREQMILLALLVGSDYTTGLQGVGPVTALEILAAFPSSCASSFTLSHNQLLMGLKEFKTWFTNGKTLARGKHSLRNKLKNITFTDGFPSLQVVQAYLNPTVDPSEEKFSWSKPDFVALVDFGKSKFGWTQIKTEEILKPVIKKIKETKYQSTLLNYFQIKHNLNPEEAQKLMSERVKSAVKKIGQDPAEADDSDDFEETKPKKIRKTKTKSKIEPSTEDNEDVGVKSKKLKKTEEGESKEKKNETRKRKGKRKTNTGLMSDEEFIDVDKIEAFLESVEKERTNEETEKNYDQEKETVKKKTKRNTNKINKKLKVNSQDDTKKISINEDKSNSEKIEELKSKESIDNKIEDSQGSSSKYFDSTVEDAEKFATCKFVGRIAALKNSPQKMKTEESTKRKPRKRVNVTEDKPSTISNELEKELKLLQETKALSEIRVKEIQLEAEKQMEQELKKKTLITRKLHRKEIIPQRQRDQKNVMRTRLKAIEVFRKSKIDPNAKKGAGQKSKAPKDDAGLSESSSDSDL